MCIFFFGPDLDPAIALGLVVGTFLVWGMVFWGRWLTFGIVGIATLLECWILVLWMFGVTTACVHGLPAKMGNERIFDPAWEDALMMMLFVFGWLSVFAAVISIARAYSRDGRAVHPTFWTFGVIAIFLQLVVMWTIGGDLRNFRRMGGDFGVPASMSPTGAYEVRFVPMSHWIDGASGNVIWKRSGEFWWHHAYQMGEALNEGGQLSWVGPTRFYFTKSAQVYDVATGKMVGATTQAATRGSM